jgi:hypothetical protein
MTESEAQLDACEFLFLTDIQELGGNRLRVVVHGGKPAGKPQSVNVGNPVISDATPIKVTSESAAFEIEWLHYVAYAILNESYASPPTPEEAYTGKRFRIYWKSHFRDYLSRCTFASDDYPGPLQHFETCCEDQIINVVSTSSPTITVIGQVPQRQSWLTQLVARLF